MENWKYFKTWKSHFSFSKIHNVSEKRLRVLLTARLAMITFIYQGLFNPLSMEIRKISKKQLSLMWFTRYIRKNIEIIFKIADIRKMSKKRLLAIIRYCTYDLRKRENFETLLEQTILEIDNMYSLTWRVCPMGLWRNIYGFGYHICSGGRYLYKNRNIAD